MNLFIKYLSIFILLLSSCSSENEKSQGESLLSENDNKDTYSWTNSNAFYSPDINEVIKNPSIYKYKGKYHLLYSSSKYSDISNIVQVSANSLHELQNAKQQLIDLPFEVKNPHILYLEEKKLWYLFASSSSNYNPIYFTNIDINNSKGWSKPNYIKNTNVTEQYSVIFYKNYVYIYRINADGHLVYKNCKISQLPTGLINSKEMKVVVINNKFHYKIVPKFYLSADKQKFFALVECINNDIIEMKLIESKTLDGNWKINEKFKLSNNIVNVDGSISTNTTINNPQLISVESINNNSNYKILYQTSSKSNTPSEFAIMMNIKN